MSTPSRFRVPSAIAHAVSTLTTPKRSMTSAGTSARIVFVSVWYVTSPARTTADAPGISTSAATTLPPVKLSHVAHVMPRVRSVSIAVFASEPPSVSSIAYTTLPRRALTSAKSGVSNASALSAVSALAVARSCTSPNAQ